MIAGGEKLNHIKLIISILVVFICISAICYIDFYIITPLLPLPQDICYYHSHQPSFFIKYFYLDSSGHVEPPFSAIHMLVLLVLGTWLGYVINSKWNKF